MFPFQVSYTIPLNQLQVQVPTAEDFQNEFSITSNVRSCTLRARYEKNCLLLTYLSSFCISGTSRRGMTGWTL